MSDARSGASDDDGWDSAAPSSPHHVLASSLFERAKALVNVGDDDDRIDPAALNEAIGLFDEIDRNFGAQTDVRLREVVADALFWKSQTLFELDRTDDALATADELKRRVATSAEPSLRKRLCHALYITAFMLRGGGPARTETRAAICREAVELFGAEPKLWFRQRLLHLMIERSFALKELGRRAEGVSLRNETRARYRHDPEISLREHAERVIVMMDGRFDIEPSEKAEPTGDAGR